MSTVLVKTYLNAGVYQQNSLLNYQGFEHLMRTLLPKRKLIKVLVSVLLKQLFQKTSVGRSPQHC